MTAIPASEPAGASRDDLSLVPQTSLFRNGNTVKKIQNPMHIEKAKDAPIAAPQALTTSLPATQR
ncbi:hypothetical protein [Xanthomonas hortorum]|uniref:hypothetical protein n=1 Tax=Xanthomonas hortorum TaxID=56454 RepID=UPI000A6028CF|nr:hypothetical protein [Xanthomonas hortorum]